MEETTTNGLNKQQMDDVSSLIKTNLSPGKVVRRPKSVSRVQTNRLSFPQTRTQYTENKAAHHHMSASLGSNDESSGSSEKLTAEGDY